MSNFTILAIHPVNRRVLKATLIDNYWGGGKYGVRFGHDVKVWRESQVTIIKENDYGNK